MKHEYGYLVKDLSTGEIDIDTHYPKTKQYADSTELVEGFKWVKVKVTYEEVSDD